MRAMILAAGRGKRMRPLTDSIPKPLLQIGGKPLIGWHLERLAADGFEDVVINVSWLGYMIADALGDGSRYGLRIRYSDEGARALETGGGIRKALPLLGPDPFLVVNADIFTELPFGSLNLPDGKLAHLVLVPNPSHNSSGDFSLSGNRVTLGAERHTFSGVGIYDPALFDGVQDDAFPLAPLLERAIAADRVSGGLWAGSWEDIGTPERFRALADRFRPR